MNPPIATHAAVGEVTFMRSLLTSLGYLRGIRVWRQNSGNVRVADSDRHFVGAPRGAADISGIIAPNGLRLEIECKKFARSKPSSAQRQWQKLITDYGGLYILIHAELTVSDATLFITKTIDEFKLKRA